MSQFLCLEAFRTSATGFTILLVLADDVLCSSMSQRKSAGTFWADDKQGMGQLVVVDGCPQFVNGRFLSDDVLKSHICRQ
jgi:hypothetical protein